MRGPLPPSIEGEGPFTPSEGGAIGGGGPFTYTVTSASGAGASPMRLFPLEAGSGRAGFVDPGAGDAAAGVVGGRDRASAAGAGLAGGAGRVGLWTERGVASGAQADRAGIGHREANAAGAEVIQVSLSDPLADRHPASAFRHPFTVAPAQRDWGSMA